MSIAVKIVTPNNTAYDNAATEVQFPGFLGQMGALEGHAGPRERCVNMG